MATRGVRNNNPLNIRRGNKWKGLAAVQTDKAFDVFISMPWGIRAAFVILRNYIKKYGCNTVPKIIARWAPSSENDTQAYIKRVLLKTGFKADTIIKPTYDDLSKMIWAMAWVESLYMPSTSDLRYSWDLI